MLLKVDSKTAKGYIRLMHSTLLRNDSRKQVAHKLCHYVLFHFVSWGYSQEFLLNSSVTEFPWLRATVDIS